MGADSLMFLGFNLHAWITIVTVLALFSVLLFTKWRSDIVFLGAIGVLIADSEGVEKERVQIKALIGLGLGYSF